MAIEPNFYKSYTYFVAHVVLKCWKQRRNVISIAYYYTYIPITRHASSWRHDFIQIQKKLRKCCKYKKEKVIVMIML